MELEMKAALLLFSASVYTPLPEASSGLSLGHSLCKKAICPSQCLTNGRFGGVGMPFPSLGLELNYRGKGL